MDDDTQNPPIIDGEIVEPAAMEEEPQETTPTPVGSPAGVNNDVAVLLDLENLIKSHIGSLETRRVELKKVKEMLNDIFNNDAGYREQETVVKEATKVKKEIKAKLSRQPNALESSEKAKNLASEIKEMDAALSDYLREYMRISGANQIEDDNGIVHEIVYIAKLLKKISKR